MFGGAGRPYNRHEPEGQVMATHRRDLLRGIVAAGE